MAFNCGRWVMEPGAHFSIGTKNRNIFMVSAVSVHSGSYGGFHGQDVWPVSERIYALIIELTLCWHTVAGCVRFPLLPLDGCRRQLTGAQLVADPSTWPRATTAGGARCSHPRLWPWCRRRTQSFMVFYFKHKTSERDKSVNPRILNKSKPLSRSWQVFCSW